MGWRGGGAAVVRRSRAHASIRYCMGEPGNADWYLGCLGSGSACEGPGCGHAKPGFNARRVMSVGSNPVFCASVADAWWSRVSRGGQT